MLIGSVSLSFEIYCKVLSESQEKVSLKYTAGLWWKKFIFLIKSCYRWLFFTPILQTHIPGLYLHLCVVPLLYIPRMTSTPLAVWVSSLCLHCTMTTGTALFSFSNQTICKERGRGKGNGKKKTNWWEWEKKEKRQIAFILQIVGSCILAKLMGIE